MLADLVFDIQMDLGTIDSSKKEIDIMISNTFFDKKTNEKNERVKISKYLKSKLDIDFTESFFIQDDWKFNCEILLEQYRLTLPVNQERIRDIFNNKRLEKVREFVSIRMNVVSLDDYSRVGKNYIIKGPVQSGKTKTVLGHVLMSAALGVNSVVCLRNITEDQNQFINSANRWNGAAMEYLHKNLVPENAIEAEEMKKFKGIEIGKIENIGEWGDKQHPINTLVILSNKNQFQRISNYLDIRIGDKRFVNLFLDEADYTTESQSADGANTIVPYIIESSLNVFAVSATTMALYGLNVMSENILYVHPCDNYKSIDYLVHEPIDTSEMVGAEYMHTEYPGLIRCIDRLDERQPFRINGTENHPTILLAKTSTKIIDHDRMTDYVLAHYPNWVTIRYNGQGVELGHQSFTSRMIIGDDVGNRNGKKHLFKLTGIQAALSFLKSKRIQFTHIFIAAGKMADRGINFVDSTYKWHITDEYLHVPKSSTCTNMIQSLRILGVFKDFLTLRLWCDPQMWRDIHLYKELDDTMLNAARYQHGLHMADIRKRVLKELIKPSHKLYRSHNKND